MTITIVNINRHTGPALGIIPSQSPEGVFLAMAEKAILKVGAAEEWEEDRIYKSMGNVKVMGLETWKVANASGWNARFKYS
jgi:hypothetical protein